MELVNKTIGCGAFKQVQAKNGKTHQVYSQLKYHSPIPNISVYYTTHKVGLQFQRKSATLEFLGWKPTGVVRVQEKQHHS